MRGETHALSGAAIWLAVTSDSALALGWAPAVSEVSLIGSVLCAGAALAADIDHRHATIAHSLPPVTQWLAVGVEKISGGHRHGTHSIVGIAAFGFIAYLASRAVITTDDRVIALGAGIAAVLLVAFAAKALGLNKNIGRRGSIAKDVFGSFLGPWLLAVGSAGLATWYLGYTWDWLPLCVVIGIAIHIVGDGLTPEGVPLLWPFNPAPPKWLRKLPIIGWLVTRVWMPNGYFRIPLLGTVETRSERKRRGGIVLPNREDIVGVLLTAYILYLVIYEFMTAFGKTNMLI